MAETTYANGVTLSAAIDAAILPVFESTAIMRNLVRVFTLGPNPNTRSLDLPIAGSVTAAVVAEAVALTPQALAQTKSTITIQKAGVATDITREAEKYSRFANINLHKDAHQAALIKKFDTDALALATGFSQSVDSGTSATLEKLMEAVYVIGLADVPTGDVFAVLSKKQAFQIGQSIRASTAAYFGNSNFNAGDALNTTRKTPGFYADIMGVTIYETNRTPTASSNNVGLVGNKDYAIAALYDTGSSPSFETAISDHVRFLASVITVKTLMWYGLSEYVDAAGCQFLSDV